MVQQEKEDHAGVSGRDDLPPDLVLSTSNALSETVF